MLATSKTMKVLELNKAGIDFDLTMVERDIPALAENEVLVEIEYVALNHLDAKLAAKGYDRWHYPHVLGLDAVGTIVDTAKGVFPSKGSRVLFHADIAEQGVLKQFAVLPNHSVCEISDELASDVAVLLPSSGMSALLAIEKLQLKKGDSLAINSAQGAVAHFAIQYAKQKGAKVFAFAQKPHHKRLTKLGADFVFDCESTSICDTINLELGPGGFDCIINTTGGDGFLRDVENLRFGGRIACLNGFPQLPEKLQCMHSPTISIISVVGAKLSNCLCAQQHLHFIGEQLMNDVSSGKISTPELRHVEFSADSVKQVLAHLLEQTCEVRPVVKIK